MISRRDIEIRRRVVAIAVVPQVLEGESLWLRGADGRLRHRALRRAGGLHLFLDARAGTWGVALVDALGRERDLPGIEIPDLPPGARPVRVPIELERDRPVPPVRWRAKKRPT